MVFVPKICVALPNMLLDLSRVRNPLPTNTTVLDDLCTHFVRYLATVQLVIREALQ